jgi:hypothetical protein
MEEKLDLVYRAHNWHPSEKVLGHHNKWIFTGIFSDVTISGIRLQVLLKR